MFHRQEIAVNKATGVPIAGVIVRAFDADGNPVTLYADASGTPIVSVSGIANAAVADTSGNYSYYIENGIYTESLYVGDTLAYSIPDLVFQGLVTTIQTPTFANAASITTSSDTNLVILSGTSTVGDSGTGRQFTYDASVDAAYVTANPNSSFVDATGRGFKEIVGSSAEGLASSLSSTAAGEGASLVGVEGGGTVQDSAVFKDANGHIALGTTPVSDAMMVIETAATGTLMRGLTVSHYADAVGSYGLEVHQYQGAENALTIHCYSDLNGNIAGAVAMQIDHTRSGQLLVLKNARNSVTSPGTTGTADFLLMSGFPDTSVPIDANPVVLAQWTYQNVLLTPQAAYPLTVTGYGMIVNVLSPASQGLVVNQANDNLWASYMTGTTHGLNATVTANGGTGLWVAKTGTGDGTGLVVQNEGTGMFAIGLAASAVQWQIDPVGHYYVGTTQVLGAQGAAVANAVYASGSTPTQAEFNAFVDQFNAWLGRARTHGLIAS